MITRGIDINKPIIAAVNGVALGGGLEVALACDLRIASDTATMGLPETRWGLMPGWGGTQRLARTVGMSAAKRMMFAGEKIKADEARRLGLIDEIAARGEVMTAATRLAEKIATQVPIAVAQCKQAVNEGAGLAIDKAVLIETELFAKCFDTLDQKNAMEAFVDKRKPGKFENR